MKMCTRRDVISIVGKSMMTSEITESQIRSERSIACSAEQIYSTSALSTILFYFPKMEGCVRNIEAYRGGVWLF
jgi:hypothetical protein